MFDRSDFIGESINDVKLTLALSIVLVVGVIFLFLRDARATMIAALALPSSLFGTFGIMYLFGYSLDTLSLMALRSEEQPSELQSLMRSSYAVFSLKKKQN